MKIKIELDFSLAYLEQYQALAKKTGRSLEDLLHEALTQYIGINNTVPKVDLTPLSKEISKLQTRLKLLENFPSEEDEPDEPDEVLEHFLPQSF
jgi:hypothetical protein